MKKILLSLFVSVIGLVGFSYGFNLNSNQIDFLDDISLNSGTNVSNNGFLTLYDMGTETNGNYINLCVVMSGFTRSSDFAWRMVFNSTQTNYSSNSPYYGVENGYNLICASGWRRYLLLQTNSTSNTFSINKFWVITPSDLFGLVNNSSCDYSGYVENSVYNECVSDLASCNSLLSGYSNSLDSCSNSYNSCSSSLNSCLQANCPDSENPLNSNSTVYIYKNDNYFPITGTNNIYVNLPSYLGYNYDYSNEGQDLNLSLAVSQDSGYLQDVQDIQYSTPNNIDFNNIITNVLPAFVPGLVLILFIYFVFRFIKKIF